jgi:hypothetical protein
VGDLKDLVASGLGSGTFSHRESIYNAAENLRLIARGEVRKNGDEAFASRSFVRIWIDVQVAVLGVELSVGAVAEVTEVTPRHADVAVDDAHDLLGRHAVPGRLRGACIHGSAARDGNFRDAAVEVGAGR